MRLFCVYALDENFQCHFCSRRKAAKFCHPVIITNSDIYINISAGQHICCEHTGQLYKKRINININFIITINTKAKNHYKDGKK